MYISWEEYEGKIDYEIFLYGAIYFNSLLKESYSSLLLKSVDINDHILSKDCLSAIQKIEKKLLELKSEQRSYLGENVV